MNKQLSHCNILVTRPATQAEKLCQLIEQHNGQAIRFPTLEIKPLDNVIIRNRIQNLSQYDWLIFISTNAVNFAVKANNGKIDDFNRSAIAAIGQSTANCLKTKNLRLDLTPEKKFNSEALLACPPFNHVEGQSILIIRGQQGRELLAETLRQRGAAVDYLEVYERIIPEINEQKVAMFKQQDIDITSITSVEALENLMQMLDSELTNKLIGRPLIVISQRIKNIAETLGFKHVQVSSEPGDEAIVNKAIEIYRTIKKNGVYSG